MPDYDDLVELLLNIYYNGLDEDTLATIEYVLVDAGAIVPDVVVDIFEALHREDSDNA